MRAGSGLGPRAWPRWGSGVWEVSTGTSLRFRRFPERRCEQRARPPPARRPSEEMVKMVLSRPCHPDDQFTTSILRHWCMKHDELLGEHIKSLLIKNNSLPRKRQRWGPRGSRATPSGPRTTAPPLFPVPCGWSLF